MSLTNLYVCACLHSQAEAFSNRLAVDFQLSIVCAFSHLVISIDYGSQCHFDLLHGYKF